jgi:hypothetical protein
VQDLTLTILPSIHTGTAPEINQALMVDIADMEKITDNSAFAISLSINVNHLARLEDVSAQKIECAIPTSATNSTASQLDSLQHGPLLSQLSS